MNENRKTSLRHKSSSRKDTYASNYQAQQVCKIDDKETSNSRQFRVSEKQQHAQNNASQHATRTSYGSRNQKRQFRNKRQTKSSQKAPRHSKQASKSRRSSAASHTRRPASFNAVSQKNFNQTVWMRKKSAQYTEASRSSQTESQSVFSSLSRLMHAIGSALLILLKKLGALLFSAFNHSYKTRIAGIIIIIVLGVGAFDFASNMNKIYSGVTVGTVDVGGMTEQEAADALQTVYEPRISANSVVFYSDEETKNNPETNDTIETIDEQISYEESLEQRKQWTTPAEEVGAAFDSAATAHAAFEVGRDAGGFPARIACLLFGHTVEPQCSFDDGKVESLRIAMSSSVGTMRKNYNVEIKESQPVVTEGHDGNEVPYQWLIESLSQGYCQESSKAGYVLHIEDVPLQITKEMAEQCAQVITNSLSQGVRFAYGETSWDVGKSELAPLVTTEVVEQDDTTYAIRPVFEENSMKNMLLSHMIKDIQGNGLAVTFQVSDDKNVRVKSNTEGKAPEVNEVLNNLNNTFFSEEARTETPEYNVPSVDMPNEMSFDDALSYGVISKISSYTTEFASTAASRNHNIRLASDTISYSVTSANGGQWSFNALAGGTTKEQGYQSSGAIVNNEYVDDIGGGVCQVATTVFNAVYNAGYTVVERHNHTLFIASYPEGRDAAIAYPDYDLVWENNTTSDVLLVMSYTKSSVTATLYGVNPRYEVSTRYGEWKKGDPYKTIYKNDESLTKGTEQVQTTGEDGKSISIERVVKDTQGDIVSDQMFESVYDPKDKVVLKGTV